MESKQKILDQLFNLYKDRIFRLCYGYTHNETEADDLVQECFLKVWTHLDDFRHLSDYSTWIYRIAVNTCLMQFRKNKNSPMEYPGQLQDNALEETSYEYEKDIQSENLYKAINQLNKIDNVIISMVLEDVSQKQIGEVLGITENNVNIKVHRIKKQLKEILTKNNEYGRGI